MTTWQDDADRAMVRTGRTHGTRSCYTGGCRCAACTEAQRAYSAHYWRTYRRPLEHVPDVPVGPVLEHVRALRAAGMGKREIARASGIAVQTIDTISRRKRGIRPATAAALLAVRYDPYRVLAIGAQRRVRALMALGWTRQHIADTAGLDAKVIGALSAGVQSWVTRTTHRGVLAAYEALSMRLGPSSRTRGRAQAMGWPPPLAWDDDDLDRLAAEPSSAGRRAA